MSLQIGLVGLPNVGKSTLFKALTRQQVEASNYPFCTIDPNVGVVPVPDKVVDQLSEMSKTETRVPAVVEFVDIAGLVKGASKGEGLGNKFLSNIREVDAIAQVVRRFNDPDVVHVHGEVNPASDQEVINLELMLADLVQVENRLKKTKDGVKTGDKELIREHNLLERVQNILTSNELVNQHEFTEEELLLLKPLNLLTAKPQLIIYNVDEEEVTDKSDGINICAKLESELAEMTEAEATEMLQELGLEKSGLNQLIQKAYKVLDLMSFYTTGEKETRAWTIKKGATAPQAAGVIHTDFEEKFIRAEVINFQDLLDAGSWLAARDAGQIRMEGKDYTFKEGDVTVFHHS